MRPDPVQARIASIYRDESRRVFATLVRLLGDFDRAEEALQDAFAAAVAQWPDEGIPDNPRAWLVTTGRYKAIDRMRKLSRFDDTRSELVERLGDQAADPGARDDEGVEDDPLRLIFTCCHPALPEDARVALTLREVCGLTTEEIARAYLARPATVAQRIVRAKRKIADAGIPYEVPAAAGLGERLDAVLRVIYLVFNEGYSAAGGDQALRPALTGEAIRLGRLLADLLPDPEVLGLLALMLLHDARRPARVDHRGDPVLLSDQDRSRWLAGQIAEGAGLVTRALESGRVGSYVLQAAIAAVHCQARSFAATDFGEIVGLYDLLLRLDPSPVVELNRAAAIAMRDGPAAGLEGIDAILTRGDLADYAPAHAARADLCEQLGYTSQARDSYERALSLSTQEPERRVLRRRLEALPGTAPREPLTR